MGEMTVASALYLILLVYFINAIEISDRQQLKNVRKKGAISLNILPKAIVA